MKYYKEIFLSKAGILAENISEQEKENVTHLKLSGYINSKDFDVLEDMCTSWGEFDEDDNFLIYEKEPPYLKVLDLGDCIMKGRAVLGDFTYHSKLEEVILPKNLENTSSSFEGTFCDSVFLKRVVFPQTLREIGYGTETASEKYISGAEKELDEFCDSYFENDTEVEKYCKEKHIPTNEDFIN